MASNKDDFDDDDRPRPRRRPNRDDDVDDDDRPQVHRRSSLDDEEDYDDRPRRRSVSRSKSKTNQVSNLGILSLSTGILALVLSFTCIGGFAVVPGLIGLVIGIIGFVVAQQSRGRQSPILPIGGSVVSLAAMIVAVVAIISFARTVKNIEKDIREGAAKWEKEEAERKVELAKASTEVKNAVAPIRLTAIQFARAYDDDEERADAVYKNKILEISGTVEEVDFVGGDDTYTVILKAGPDDTVHCEFAKDPAMRARLAQLKPGDMVVIRGKCLGGSSTIEACVFP
jgi:membrane protein implicated in regulation of membrane protease activity